MSVRVYDFRCASGHVHESFEEAGTCAVQCPECDQLAYRLVAAPRAKLEGITGAFPSAADKWAKLRESKMAQEQRTQENHGTYR